MRQQSERLTIRYPPPQLVTIIPIATDSLAEPKTFPTTVGMVAKNDPFDAPFTTTNRIIGPRVVETGHNASMLMALRENAMNSVFSGPSLSQRKPEKIRPMADEKLNPETRPAPVLDDRPIDRLYNGRKNGGTRRGNVPTAPARNKVVKRRSRNRLLYEMSANTSQGVCNIGVKNKSNIPLNKASLSNSRSLLD